MSVKIRLIRFGRRNSPFYRVVAIDSRVRNGGKYIEKLGFYNPKIGEFSVNNELMEKWLKNGAIMSETVNSLFKKSKKKDQLNKNNDKLNDKTKEKIING